MPTEPLPDLPPPPPPPDVAAPWNAPEIQAQLAAMMAQAQAQLAALVAALNDAAAQLALAPPPKPPEMAPPDPMPPPAEGIPIDFSLLSPPVFTWTADDTGEVVCGLPPVDFILPVAATVPPDAPPAVGTALAGELASPAWQAVSGPLAPLPQVWEAPALPQVASASLAALLEPDTAAPWGAAGVLFHGAEGGVF